MRLDTSRMKDIRVENKECGCITVFFKESGYATSRLDFCELHNKRDGEDERTRIVEAARAKKDAFLEEAKGEIKCSDGQ